jgi:hypothetical protein
MHDVSEVPVGSALKVEPAVSYLEVNNIHVNGLENVKSYTVLI